MRAVLKKTVIWAAIYAVALQTMLLGLAGGLQAAQAASFDPLAVICHSVAPSDDADASGSQPAAPVAHICDQCILCCAASATVPDRPALAPPHGLHGERVAAPLPRSLATPRVTSVHLARGPPLTA